MVDGIKALRAAGMGGLARASSLALPPCASRCWHCPCLRSDQVHANVQRQGYLLDSHQNNSCQRLLDRGQGSERLVFAILTTCAFQVVVGMKKGLTHAREASLPASPAASGSDRRCGQLALPQHQKLWRTPTAKELKSAPAMPVM